MESDSTGGVKGAFRCTGRAPDAGLGRESGVSAEREGGVGSSQVKAGGKERDRLGKTETFRRRV